MATVLLQSRNALVVPACKSSARQISFYTLLHTA